MHHKNNQDILIFEASEDTKYMKEIQSEAGVRKTINIRMREREREREKKKREKIRVNKYTR